MRRLIAYHGRCLDGIASAALVGRLLDHSDGPADELRTVALAHTRGNRFDASVLSADQNVVVDFKYSDSERLHVWFDHHASAFADEALRAHYETRPRDRFVLDTQAPSCARVIATHARVRYGLELADEASLQWIDRVDTARFDSAEQAISMQEPALQLMAFAEQASKPADADWLREQLFTRPLADIAAEPRVQDKLQPLRAAIQKQLEFFGQHMQHEGPVVYTDLTAQSLDGLNKFVGYYLCPEALYSVVVMRGPARAKVSVGCNPWRADERRHDIAALCEPHGGGGHAAVGAVSFSPDAVDEARRVALQIKQQLSRTT